MRARIPRKYISATALGFLSATVFAGPDPGQADKHFQAQEWQQAADSYRALTLEDQSNGLYWFRLGQSHWQLKQYAAAIEPLEKALVHRDDKVPTVAVLLSLARSQAAAGQQEAALNSIAAMEGVGGNPYLAVKNSVEFSDFNSSTEFLAVLNKLNPCLSDEHRAFDLWLGEWDVSSPVREGWSARSSITVGNDGCSVHESYSSQGGYAGTSVSFYDSTKGKWHQTWIDNQGAPLYLEGGFEDGAMILSDATSRVTWTTEADKRVRQHWESTTDGGKTWTTAFDGYYRKR